MVESTLWADRIDACQSCQWRSEGIARTCRCSFVKCCIPRPGLGKEWSRSVGGVGLRRAFAGAKSLHTNRNPAQVMDTPTQARSATGKTSPHGSVASLQSHGPGSRDALSQMVTSMVKMVQAGSSRIG